MRRFDQWWEGEAEKIETGGALTVACCDCGKVHDFTLKVDRGTTPGKDTITIVVHSKPRLTLWRRQRMRETKEGLFGEEKLE